MAELYFLVLSNSKSYFIYFNISFYNSSNINDSILAELRLCISLKLPAVIIKLDAKLIVDLFKKPDGHQNCIDTLVSDCRTELGNIPRVQINHCYHEVNKCANALARRGALLSQDFVLFLDSLVDVSLLLSLDSTGVAYDRFVPV